MLTVHLLSDSSGVAFTLSFEFFILAEFRG